MSSNVAKTIQTINKEIEQADTCKQLAKVQKSAEKQLKRLLDSLQKQLAKLKPMKAAGENISEPSADLSKLVKTAQDIIKYIQTTVTTIAEQIAQVTADIAEITTALATLSTTIANKANVLNCVIDKNGKIETPPNSDATGLIDTNTTDKTIQSA